MHLINDGCHNQYTSGRMPSYTRPANIWWMDSVPLRQQLITVISRRGKSLISLLHWNTHMSTSISLINSRLINTHLQATCQSADPRALLEKQPAASGLPTHSASSPVYLQSEAALCRSRTCRSRTCRSNDRIFWVNEVNEITSRTDLFLSQFTWAQPRACRRT